MFNPRFLLISLGNPAPYTDTLHSAGHFALSSVQKALWGSQPRFNSERYGGKSCLASIGETYMMLQSPTLMNVSGPWVAKAWKQTLETHNLKPSELSLILVHDDLEEDLGAVKIKKWKSSHRGHNGIKSVNASLNPSNFPDARWSRLSIGIDRPTLRDQATVSDYVLKKMTRYQKDVLQNQAGPQVIECLKELQDVWEQDVDKTTPKATSITASKPRQNLPSSPWL